MLQMLSKGSAGYVTVISNPRMERIKVPDGDDYDHK